MTKVLRRAALGERAHPVGLPATGADPSRHPEIYERGVADGYERGVADARAEAARLVEAIHAAFAGGAAALRDAQAEDAREILEIAVALARHVAGEARVAGASETVSRVEAAIAQIDDRPLRIAVHPEQAVLVRDALAGLDGVTVAGDASLAPGEAVASSAWSRAALTEACAWRAVREALDLGEEAGETRGL